MTMKKMYTVYIFTSIPNYMLHFRVIVNRVCHKKITHFLNNSKKKKKKRRNIIAFNFFTVCKYYISIYYSMFTCYLTFNCIFL